VSFLRDYWAWIAVPFALVLGGLALLYLLAGDGGPSDFVYTLF